MVAMVEVGRSNNDFFKSFLPVAVNSPPAPHRDPSAPGAYRPYDEYATVQRRSERTAPSNIEQERTKKDKKWSLGKLFRRKKKENETASSSESEEGVSGLSPKKNKKKKKNPSVNNFDHIVMRDTRRAQSLAKTNIRDIADDGVLSDPSAGFINYRIKTQDIYGNSKESLSLRDENLSKSARNGLECPSRKVRKSRLKARVEAIRNSMRGESSSDEESMKSSNSSSMIRFRSDDSLMRSRDSSLNKKSRSARNERYIKRLSRDDENQLNKEAELLQQGYTKAEVEMLTRTPTSQSSGYGTCKRDQNNKVRQDQLYGNDPNRRPMKSESVSSFPSTQSYPSSINFNAKVNNEHINYSIQYPSNNKTRQPLYANNNRERSISSQYENPDQVVCVKFPLGNVTNIKRDERAPPVPPPRDMQRKVVTPLSMYYEPNSAVDRLTSNQNNVHGVLNNDFERVMRRSQERSVSNGMNGLRRPISNSEDHIAMQNSEFMLKYPYNKTEQPRRPASVSAEPNHYGMYVNTPLWRKKVEQANIIKPEPIKVNEDYLYFADQSPRSRRPISVTAGQNGHDNQYLSDSQASLNITDSIHRRPRAASEFWKKIDDAERQKKYQNIFSQSRSNSEYSSRNPLQKQPIMYANNRVLQNRTDNIDSQNKNNPIQQDKNRDTVDGAKMWNAKTEYKRSITVEPPKSITSPTNKTHVRHKSDTFIQNTYQPTSDEERNTERRKSTNLDDALNELEAIYNSLGLGDEDLLDRAERRELMTPKFNDWNGNDDEIQFRSQPATPLRRVPRRSTLPDKLQDDMAFRRLNSTSKEKSNHNENQAQISYMLASPVYVPYASDDDRHSERNEPDIVYDDVMYRNIKQTNNRLKTVEPQPPFGIPVGPVSPAPQSDYLHATPENKGRSRFIPRRSPDLVSDDLAYRSLRKDNRHSGLFNGDEYVGPINNDHNYNEFPFNKEPAVNLKKKRAVRSLSANIFTMIQKEIDEALNMSKVATLQKTQSNSDVMKRLRETFENNDKDSQDHYPRNKVKHRHNTVGFFVNNSYTPAHHFAKDDSYVHNDDKYVAKSPFCDKSSKSSSPLNRSPQFSKRSSKDEFQQVLSMLAQEAMDTSNKLGVALAELDKNKNSCDKKCDVQSRISDSRLQFLNGLTNKSDENIAEIKHVKVHSEIVNDTKPFETPGYTDNSKGQKTKDSLLAISNQLNKVEDQLKQSFEKELNITDESSKVVDYVSKPEEKHNAQTTNVLEVDKSLKPDIVPLRLCNDTIEVKNKSEPFSQPSRKNSLNPFLNCDEKVTEINEIDAFKELKDGISDLIAGISQVNDKLFVPKCTKVVKGSVTEEKISTMTEANEKLDKATKEQPKQDVPMRSSVNLSIYEDDLVVKKDTADSTEYNSSEELATIFRLDGNPKQTSICNDSDKVRDDLSSPKLVQSINQQLRRLSVDNTDTCTPSQSNNSQPTNVVPWRTKRQNLNRQNENRGEN